ncbi:MAG: hypothetical protein K6F64_08945 [Clostridia bacterium]|nr:hypothetical protein [Clostridia bacterium]
MSEFVKTGATEEDIDAILREVHGEAPSRTEKDEDTEPARNWSMDEIDRLIAEANGEEYIPPEPKPDAPSEKYAKFFSGEFDSSIFSVQPIKEDEKPEMQDISSGEAPEVEGQETFFPEEEEKFEFDMQTVVMPDDVHEAPEIKYNNKVEEPETLPPAIDTEKQEKPEDNEEPLQNNRVEPLGADVILDAQGNIDYRAMFFKKLKLDDIYEPVEEEKADGPVDVSGIVVRKTDGAGEEGLDPLPQVMAAEDYRQIEEEKTKIAGLRSEPKTDQSGEDVEGQIVLNGFVDIPEEAIPEKTREFDVEENLWARRRQKAKSFKLDELDDDEFSDDFDELPEDDDIPAQDDQETPEEKKKEPKMPVFRSEPSVEYTHPNERNRIHSLLTGKVERAKKGVIITGIINAVLLILALVPPLSELFQIEGSVFTRNSMILCVINAVLIIAAAAVDSEMFFDSFSGLFKGRVTGDTAVSLALALALFENALSAITGAYAAVFGVIAVWGLLVGKITKYIDAKRTLSNFSICAFNYEHDMYAVHTFDNESEIFELGRGLLMGNAEMLYSSNVEFPSDFIANSEKRSVNDKYIKLMTLGGAVVSAIAGIAVGIVEKNFMTGFATFTGAFCLSAPIFSKFIPSFITYITDSRLNHEGSMIVNLETAEKTAAANAVVLDSADIFDRNACTMHGMKDFKSMRIDVVILYAAAMVIKSGGPLKECFERVVDGRQDLLPPVRELVYEDKMGISARIYEQKVLLGNRNMLIHHNIKAPEKSFEDRYTHSGRKVIYLACNEQLAAMFVVSYRVDEAMKNYLKQLESNGIQTLVRTNDVNVTEELISERFGLKQNDFKILSSVAGRLYKRRRDTVTDRLPAGIIHDGKAISMLRAVSASCTMATKSKLGTILQIALMVISIALSVLIGVTAEHGLSAAFGVLIMLAESAGLTGILMLGKK